MGLAQVSYKFLTVLGLVWAMLGQALATAPDVDMKLNTTAVSEHMVGAETQLLMDEIQLMSVKVAALEALIVKLNARLGNQERAQQNSLETKTVKTGRLPSLREAPPMNFEVWAGILLGASALIMTVLGVGIAIMAFIGYRQVLGIAEKTAREFASPVAKAEATKTAREVTIKTSHKTIESQIRSGAFDVPIRNAVDLYTYRGVGDGTDAIHQEPEEGET